jgi:hypothetical protein
MTEDEQAIIANIEWMFKQIITEIRLLKRKNKK